MIAIDERKYTGWSQEEPYDFVGERFCVILEYTSEVDKPYTRSIIEQLYPCKAESKAHDQSTWPDMCCQVFFRNKHNKSTK